MCGIAGYFGLGQSKLLADMLESIRHRGPDSEGNFFGDQVGLGIRRLAIVDVDHGNQPIHNEKKTLDREEVSRVIGKEAGIRCRR